MMVQATALRSEKKWDDANALFEQIKDYKDSAELIHLHNYKVSASESATCEKDGYKEFKCSICGQSHRDEIKATGHNYSDATCLVPKKCKNCEKTSGKALGHTGETTKCSRCGKLTFKTLKYSGNGPRNVTGINLPIGSYNVTYTHSGDWNFIVSGNFCDVGVNLIGEVSYVEQIHCTNADYALHAVAGPYHYGSLENGYINITAADGYWTITIEAIS